MPRSLPSPTATKLLSLLLPGAGTILAGRPWIGLIVGVVFAAAANLAVVAILILPDHFGGTIQGLIVGVAGGCYVGAQLRVGRDLREQRQRAARATRDAALETATQALQEGHILAALEALEPISDLAEKDLIVAHRLAQALTAAGEVGPALDAWGAVRALDRHRLYRDERLAAEATLRGTTINTS